MFSLNLNLNSYRERRLTERNRMPYCLITEIERKGQGNPLNADECKE